MAEQTPSETAPPATRTRPRRPWRDNLEAFGVAILMAVLLKPMIIEAYQIPTPSMQPTLMGSTDAGVFDRILVDKQRYELVEPKRWDIAVFRYPIRRNQNYVKRIVGMPGDRMRIAGGNIYQVSEDARSIESIRRKPDRIQAGLWKQIYPARCAINPPSGPESDRWKLFFEGAYGSWKSDGDDLLVSPSRSGKSLLNFTDTSHDGLSNQIYDGYPEDQALAIHAGRGGQDEVTGVQDIRFSMALTPDSTPSLVQLQLRLTPDGRPARRYRLEIANGMGRLVIGVGGMEVAATEPFDCAVPPREATELAFAHVDDRLIAWHEGTQVAKLEVGEHRFALPLLPRQIQLSCEASGEGELRLSDLVVDRDLHYVPEGLSDALAELVPEGLERVTQNHVIAVPPGHYFMMGDNTLASADSRQWKVIAIGMAEDGELVNPKTNPQARVLRGNKRPWSLEVTPDPDENPVIVRSNNTATPDSIAFTNDNGDVFAMRGRVAPGYNPQVRDGGMQFMGDDGNGTAYWVPEDEHVFFVPREHILGRPVMAFWPISRIGFIR